MPIRIVCCVFICLKFHSIFQINSSKYYETNLFNENRRTVTEFGKDLMGLYQNLMVYCRKVIKFGNDSNFIQYPLEKSRIDLQVEF